MIGKKVISLEKKTEFFELFKEFMSSFALMDIGKKHLSKYKEGRDLARENYQLVKEKFESGQDTTWDIIWKFLPYADNQNNKDKGAWIHISGWITSLEVMQEKAGNVNPEDWPKVASLLYRFYQRVFEKNDLKDACDEFSSSEFSKGFQTGSLTPLLNALEPDKYILINNKSRKVLNYFTDSSFGQKLTYYPETNNIAFELMKVLMGVIESSNLDYDSPYDVFDQFCHWLVAIKKYPPVIGIIKMNYWKIAPGENANNWEKCNEGGFIAIGWGKIGDLRRFKSKKEIEKEFLKIRKENPNWRTGGIVTLWRFISQIKVGDKIIANKGMSSVVGIGEVTGEYYFEEDGDRYPHRIKVKWEKHGQWDLGEKHGWRPTITKLDKSTYDEILQKINGSNGPKIRAYSIGEFAKETGFPIDRIQNWVTILKRKKQMVFFGPPGTGKTFLATRLAKLMVAGSGGFIEKIQFHPAYSYEDFLEGIRPETKGNIVHFPVKAGIFRKFCEEARKHTGSCVLVIDEFNRANVARVFGELMYLLEYRNPDDSIKLPYSGEVFCIPENVYIIGTMNTADRSIALIDHALRRRFAFEFLGVEYSILENYLKQSSLDPSKLIEILKEINTTIGNEDFSLGISFFLVNDIKANIQAIWLTEIEPYLKEYFYDNLQKLNDFRWDKVKTRLNWV